MWLSSSNSTSVSCLLVDSLCCRTDIDGSVDSVMAPTLPQIGRSRLSTYSSMPADRIALHSDEFLNILTTSGLSPQLFRTFSEIHCLSHAVNYVAAHEKLSINPVCLDEDTLSIQYDLLTIPHIDDIAEACRLGALIYMKSITRPMWTVLRTSEVLVVRLKASLDGINDEPTASPLLVWLCFMGGIACESGTSERMWFADKLARLRLLLPDEVSGWPSVRLILKGILWIDNLHDRLGQALWHEIVSSRAEASAASEVVSIG